jgi:hypothetical protein
MSLTSLLVLGALSIPAPAAGDPPFLTDLVFLPGDDAVAPAAGAQISPEIAAGGPGYLAVWVDVRTSLTSLSSFSGGPVFHPYIGSMWDIYAARLDADGNLIDDQAPIVVAQQILNQGMPDVAWNGENWLVVWSGQEGMACCSDIHLYAARVSPDGVLLDPDPIEVDPVSDDTYWPTVGSDGTNWLVVWRDWDLQEGVATLDGTRIAPDGTVLDPGGVHLRHDVYNSYPIDPDLAWAGDEYLLVWEEDSGEIAGQRVASDLQKIGGVFRINTYGPSEGHNPRVATNGTEFFVAYWEDRYYGWSQLYGARVAHDGAILDPAGIEVTEYADYTNFEPAMDYDGTNYVVVYGLGAFEYDLYATRVAPDGTVLDPGGIPISIAPYYHREPAVACGAQGTSLVLWLDSRHDGSMSGDIFAATLSTDRSVGEHFCVSLGTPRQTGLRMTAAGDGFAAVFKSETSVASRILFQRMDGTGAPLDLEPIEIAAGDFEIASPSIAWNGSVYLVVWSDTGPNEIYGRRVDASGAVLDASPIAILPGDMPDVAALGDEFLVVSSHEDPHEIRRPKAVRVDESGQVLGSPAVIGSSYALVPRVTAFGERWLAVWEQWPSHDNTRANLYAAFVGGDGLGQGSFLVTYDAIAASSKPAIAVAGDTALIVWHDNRQAPEAKDLFMRRILSDGTLLDPQGGIRVTSAANSQFDPAAAWDGDQYVLAYGDFRNDSSLDQHRGDIYGARVSGSGEVIDPDGFPVADDDPPEMLPAVASAGGVSVIGASVFRQEAQHAGLRIAVRVLGPGLGSASTPESAASGLGGSIRVAPNPSSAISEISLMLASGGPVSAAVYDILGRTVRQLHDGAVPAGAATLRWDGRDDGGRPVAPGLYLVRVRSAEAPQTTKILRR